MRLAKGGGYRVFIHFHAAAGEGDLSGVRAEMFAPHGEDDAGLGSVGDGNEHGGFFRRVRAKLRMITFERRL
jgi:hypothetical protein